jgi:hypothetical protein
MSCNKIQSERNVILHEFKSLGFWGKTAFFNVCKSIDVTLNGFELVRFYQGDAVSKAVVSRLYAILERLKNE